ncbi:hypothetical protein PHYBOEH_002438 [Phytophthora boehmeriae]|uniref:RxLR effector protein n=1 Tax=Phytophthora boehmeriae TaxID=109152 RepID=A0A8T1WSA1_9STRA|nr:hypothetical protein PHYBOEH_002438 [Phytophthora boehmeriae]
MRVSYVLLTAAVSLFVRIDGVLAAKDFDHTKISSVSAAKSPLESTAEPVDHSAKRHLRADDQNGATASITDEERMLINSVVEKIAAAGEKNKAITRAVKKPQKYGQWITAGEKTRVAARAVKEPQKYEQWIAAGLSPSAVRVDVMKIQPWTKKRATVLLHHPLFYQYFKFKLKYEEIQKAKATVNAAT